MTRAPRIADNGVPFCSRERCPAYDALFAAHGKRCEEMGFSPDAICEPEVASMAAELRRLRVVAVQSQVAREPVDAGGGP